MGQRENRTEARGVQELGCYQTVQGNVWDAAPGRKQGEQIHYSLGTENCLREFAGAGSSTSISFSWVVMRTSGTVDMRVEWLRRPGEPEAAANQGSMIRRQMGATLQDSIRVRWVLTTRKGAHQLSIPSARGKEKLERLSTSDPKMNLFTFCKSESSWGQVYLPQEHLSWVNGGTHSQYEIISGEADLIPEKKHY